MATLAQASNFYRARHGTHPLALEVVPRLAAAYTWFSSAGLSEKKFEAAIKAGHDPEYFQNLSEMLVAYRLHQDGFEIRRSSRKGGPDFVAIKGDVKVQIEVVAPRPLPEVDTYLRRHRSGVFTVPLREFLMCWTKGIAAKATQLLGSRKIRGWREKKLVDEQAPFVIAVNGCLFSGMFDEGFRPPLGGHPWAAVALYAISDPTIQLDRQTGQRLWAGFEHRKELARSDKGAIPLNTFLDPNYAPISAVWAMSFDHLDLLCDEPEVVPRQHYASAVLHNPNAEVALGIGSLPAYEEWAITPDADGYGVALVLDVRPKHPGDGS